MVGLWSVGTAAATTVSWVGAHAVSNAIRATAVPAVPPAAATVPAQSGRGLAGRNPAGSPGATTVLPPAGRSAPPVPTRPVPFSDPGGIITVRCTGGTIELLSASPSDGYRGDVQSAGPTRVSVTFLSRDWSFQIDARCSGGRPVEHTTVNQSPSPPPPH